jgi:hypothetical protein
MARHKKEPEKESPKIEAKAEVKESEIPVIKGPKKVIVTPEQLARLQEEKRLIGYDPLTCEATIL